MFASIRRSGNTKTNAKRRRRVKRDDGKIRSIHSAFFLLLSYLPNWILNLDMRIHTASKEKTGGNSILCCALLDDATRLLFLPIEKSRKETSSSSFQVDDCSSSPNSKKKKKKAGAVERRRYEILEDETRGCIFFFFEMRACNLQNDKAETKRRTVGGSVLRIINESVMMRTSPWRRRRRLHMRLYTIDSSPSRKAE